MTTVGQIESSLFQLAPRQLMQSWDNVGLLVGNTDRAAKKVLVALDITEDVVQEAVEGGFDLIAAHHPVMNCTWHPVQTIREDDSQGRVLTTLIRHQIAAICMHTNLDSAQGGVNDVLAAKMELKNVSPLGEDGIGRVGELAEEMALADFASYVKKRLGANGVRYADGGRPVRRVAVGGGACGDYTGLAVSLGCDTFVTADLKYHDFQNAAGMGINLIDAGHFPTEDVICPVLQRYLSEQFPGLQVRKSVRHHEVIQYV